MVLADAPGGGRARLVARAMAALLCLTPLPAAAQEVVVDQWYAALAAADRGKLESLLAGDAKIRLIDLGVEQSKAEYVASLDAWEAAVAGATIRHRIEKREGAVTTVIACYDFPANDMLMQETFSVADSRITVTSQAAMAENCDAY